MPAAPRAAGGPRLAARLAVAAAVGLAAVLLERTATDGGPPPGLRRLELLTLDWRFRLRGPRPPGPEVALAMIDDRSVRALGRWPPPRQALAAAVDRLAEAGARTVVLNLLLAEPTDPRLPPAARDALGLALTRLAPGDEAARAGLEALLAADAADTALGTAIARASNVVLPYALAADARGGNIAGVPPWIAATAYPAHAARPGAEPAAGGADEEEAPAFVTAAAGLAAVGAGSGHANLLPDEDGALRSDLPALARAGAYYPSLAVEAARLHLGLPRAAVVPWLGERLELGPGRSLPLDHRSRLLVDHRGPEGGFPTVSLADLLAGRADPASLRDRLVVLGASAAGTGDRFATPFTARLPGSEHLAAVIDTLLRGRALRRDGPVRAADALATLALALLAALAAGRRSLPLSLAAALGLAALWALAAQLALARWAWWLALVGPACAALAAAGAVEALRAGGEQRRRRRLERQRANLARYFPPAVVDRLAAGAGGRAGLERTQRAAVMFVDIVGFTRAGEGLAPAAAVELLRGFHRLVERAVFAHGGMVDKFMGDGAMACFGVPDPTPTAAADALRAARAVAAAMAAWGAELRAAGLPPLRAGVGVHVGPVLMGDIGGERQFQFTVVGDTVNVASRLEALTRQVGASVVVSAAVVEEARAAGAGDDALAGLEPLPSQQLRGRDGWLVPWRLPTPPEEVRPCVQPAAAS